MGPGLRQCGILAVLVGLGAALAAGAANGEDWPTFRRDAARSGVSAETLTFPLVEHWSHTVPYRPTPAFGPGYPKHTNWEGGVEKRRIDFDRADSLVVADGRAYFGSVGDGKVYCLDAASGALRWTFLTGGPVRLAPTVDRQRVYFGSDDGHVYCLRAGDGELVWKFRAAPDDLRVVGNGRLISLWPVRTGVLVDREIAYFGAGIFPSEGVFLYAVDAGTGRVLWKNDEASETRFSQVSPQGYLLATAEELIVPMSRQAPAIYERRGGRMQRRLSIYYGGGTFAALNGNCLYTGCEAAQCFPLKTDQPGNHGTSHTLASFPGGQLVFSKDRLFSCGTPRGEGVSSAVVAYAWNQPDRAPTADELRRGERTAPPPPKELWKCALPEPLALIQAGETLLVGSPGQVTAVNAADGSIVWQAAVQGEALSLSAARGRLYVSTDAGRIYCFGAGPAPRPGPQPLSPAAGPEVGAEWKAAVDTILREAPYARRGFAIVYGVETGELAIELARRTELRIHAVSADPAKVEAARRRIDAAGLYGGRIVVEQAELSRSPFTQYVADLVVSETAFLTGAMPGDAGEAFRLTKPIRGALVVGRAAGDDNFLPALERWAAGSPWPKPKTSRDRGVWAASVRPALDGARPWTHQYAGPQNTNSSDDELVRAPLRVQWFGDPGPGDFVDRHYWAAAPLALDGRAFICSYKEAAAYDIYTGVQLWSFPLENATRAHLADVPGNVAVGPEGYFVAVDDVCYRLDPATGELLGKYVAPGSTPEDRRMWGYVACVDGVLLGTRTLGYLPLTQWRKSKREQVGYWMLSDLLFALDARTGRELWRHAAPAFRHNNIVAQPAEPGQAGAVFVSYAGGTDEQRQAALVETRPFIEAFEPEVVGALAKRPPPAHVEWLSALDLTTGRPHWQRAVDWTVCGGHRGTLILKNGLLLQLSDVGGCKAWNGYGLNDQLGRSIAARRADNGDLVWLKALNHRSRAVVVKDRIFGEPWCFDLQTAKRRMTTHPITGESVPWMFMRAEKHCGPFNASAHMLFFRNGGFGYVDVDREEGVSRFESVRPNCWTSFISAEGLALWPASDSGCRCNLANSCTVALVHDERNRAFADFASEGAVLPVQRLAVNFGAAGDRRDTQGRLWLNHPREKFTGAIELPLQVELLPEGGFASRNATWNPIANTDLPWIYTSAANGVKRVQLTLRRPEDRPARYAVTLHFAAPPGEEPGQRVFDLAVQGQPVKTGLDIARAAGGAEKAFTLSLEPISVAGDLALEFAARGALPACLAGLEVRLADD